MKAKKTFMQKIREQEGQTTIEYVLVIILIALVLVGAFGGRAQQAVQNAADYIGQQIEGSATS
jgi:Flp pilus assembly pilin Flp